MGNPQQPQKLKAPSLAGYGSLHLANLRVVTVALKFHSDGKWLGIWIFSFCGLSTLVVALSLAHQITGVWISQSCHGTGLSGVVLVHGSADLTAQRVPWPCSTSPLASLSLKSAEK